MDTLIQLATRAKALSKILRTIDTSTKNTALLAISTTINAQRANILMANEKDINQGKIKGLDAALLDRLSLNDVRIDNMIESLRQIVSLPDPVGEITDLKYRPSGIQVGKMRSPLGVIGIIYESRPNVTLDAAALCLKSGNVAILRGGKEAIHSNIALYDCIQSGLEIAGLDKNMVQFITNLDRKIVQEMTHAVGLIDVIIPRGGKGLIKAVSQNAQVPVIKHLHGVCHTYIDKYGDIDKAIAIAFNAKTRRYGVCNATETLLVHQDIANKVMPTLVEKYLNKGVELRGCAKTQLFSDKIIPATDLDWETEYSAPILSIRIVNNLNEAMAHIEQYGSKHTESIVSENYSRVRVFLTQVDSSSVMVNASTGFADGFEYGLGAEIGISTGKIHVQGPVGLEGLTSQKYIVLGDGHIRP